MQRWQITTGLAAATVLAALIVPSLRGGDAGPGPQAPLSPPQPLSPPPPPVVDAGTGLLSLSGELDQQALLLGSGEDRYLVFDVQAQALAGDVRRPVNLAVVVDTSGSMAGRGKIDNARMAARELVGLLNPEDSFSLVTFDDRGRVRVASGPVTDRARLDRAVMAMAPAGGTNLYDGLELGLKELQRADQGGVKRVILLSDGMANVGVTDPASLVRLSGSLVQQGISVSGLGLGLDYNEDLLAAMSDAGGGSYRFVDRPGQLASLFTQELHQMTAVAGREVSLDVKLPPGVVLQEVYGWDSAVTRDGYRVFLGDVHGGETRKIVARVKVLSQEEGALQVATGALAYTDPDSGDAAQATATVSAEITRQREIAMRSVNAPAADKAAQAVSATLMDRAVRAYEEGDVAEQKANMAAASGILRSTGARTGNADLNTAAADFDELSLGWEKTANTSDDGIYQVKKAKESARVLSR